MSKCANKNFKYALIQWSATKETSVVPVNDLLTSQTVGEESKVRYGADCSCKATIKLLGSECQYLH